MEKNDRNDLRTAVVLLERPRLGIRLVSLVGYPIEGILRALPGWISRSITHLTARAVGTVFYYALCTLRKKSAVKPFSLLHRMMVLVSGFVGGFFGLLGMVLELPISTTLMLRSIAEIGRSEGEDLSTGDTQLACITVFALGGKSKEDDAAETAYYAARAAVTRAVSEAAEYLAERGIAEEGTPVLIRIMANLASRFGVILTDKMAAELVPILGGLGGAAINFIFIRHFQEAARGHFIVRRLERKYGHEPVKREYESFLEELRQSEAASGTRK
jgi:hypothetical protein